MDLRHASAGERKWNLILVLKPRTLTLVAATTSKDVENTLVERPDCAVFVKERSGIIPGCTVRDVVLLPSLEMVI